MKAAKVRCIDPFIDVPQDRADEAGGGYRAQLPGLTEGKVYDVLSEDHDYYFIQDDRHSAQRSSADVKYRKTRFKVEQYGG